MKKSRLLSIVFCCVFTSYANAVPIQFDFEGFVTSSEIIEGPNQGQPLNGAPITNSAISGYYIFEAPSADTYPSPGDTMFAHYNNVTSMVLNMGSLTYSYSVTSPTSRAQIRIENGSSSLVRDRYTVIARNGTAGDITGPDLGGFSANYFQLDIFDFEGGSDPDLLIDESLPIVAPDLNLVTDYLGLGPDIMTSILLQYDDGSVRGQLRGQLTSLSNHNTIPIPAALWLFGSGLLGLIGVGRKKSA